MPDARDANFVPIFFGFGFSGHSSQSAELAVSTHKSRKRTTRRARRVLFFSPSSNPHPGSFPPLLPPTRHSLKPRSSPSPSPHPSAYIPLPPFPHLARPRSSPRSCSENDSLLSRATSITAPPPPRSPPLLPFLPGCRTPTLIRTTSKLLRLLLSLRVPSFLLLKSQLKITVRPPFIPSSASSSLPSFFELPFSPSFSQADLSWVLVARGALAEHHHPREGKDCRSSPTFDGQGQLQAREWDVKVSSRTTEESSDHLQGAQNQ